MSQTHYDNRMRYAQHLKSLCEADDTYFARVINTDFSGFIRLVPKTNSHNSGAYLDPEDLLPENRLATRKLLSRTTEKHSKGAMLHGGICR